MLNTIDAQCHEWAHHGMERARIVCRRRDAGYAYYTSAEMVSELADRIIAARTAQAQEFDCPRCGQHITDGNPCGCGAR